MDQLWLVGVCLVLGFVLGRMQRLPANAPMVINGWVIDIALPALVLVQIPQLHLELSLLFAISAAWIVFVGSWLLMRSAGKLFHWPQDMVGALILTCGLGNTAFMGYPLIRALLSEDALGIAVIADQFGTFLALSSIAVIVAMAYSGGTANPADLARRVLRFPPFLALLGGFLVMALGGWHPMADKVLRALAQTLTPLALFSVGLQFRLSALRGRLGAVAFGLGWKMAIAPLLVLGLGTALGQKGLMLQVPVLQAAMGPMITSGVLAEQHKLAPPVATAVVGLGTLLALISVPAWHCLLVWIG